MTPTIPLQARAAVITSFDKPLEIKDDQRVLQPSELNPRECLVKIDFAGVCHSDLHIKEGGWGPVKFPRVAGHEGIGHVVAIGEHTVGSPVKVGDRVGIKWIANACLSCEMCRTGNDICCSQYTSHGYSVDGSFSDYALSYVDYVTPIPEALDSAAATPLLCAGVTVYKALKETKPQVGRWVAIPGAGGGLGHLGVQYAVAMGLRVIAIDTGDAKRDLCLQLGAEKFVDFKTSTDLIADVKNAADGKGPHAAIIVAAIPGPIDQALMYLRPTGTLVSVGIPSGRTSFSVPIGLFINKRLTIIGSAVGNRQDVAEALEIAASGKVACRYEVKPFKEINAIFDDLAAQKIAGRVVVQL
ncbi:mannitol-1-phosphate dehydrogenase [Favolaschia claudopus]|uniref:alcohol dehydrogenase n=1 Tax=Favolaschia claudopus TaxID=2862362 RepID=A0AAW0CD10_9AGAR